MDEIVRPRVAAAIAAIAVAGLAAACASAGGAAGASGVRTGAAGGAGSRTIAGGAAAGECPPAPDAHAMPATLRVAAPGSVHPDHVPSPGSPAERLAFRQMYRTLLSVGCDGRVRADLADAWRARDGGRRWRFHLRGGARFWDGTRLTAGDVAWSWRRLAEARAGSGSGRAAPGRGGLLEVPPALPDSIEVVDAATLELFYGGAPPPAAAFADPRLAVLRAGPGPWPVGSGPLRPRAAAADDSGALVLTPVRGPGPTLVLWPEPGGEEADARDLLDDGFDVVVTSDPRTRRYAGTLPGYRQLPMPWTRSYVLLVTGAGDGRPPSEEPADAAAPLGGEAGAGVGGGGGEAGDGEAALRALRISLARDAVRAEAVPSGMPAWLEGAACGAGSALLPADRSGPSPAAGRPPRVRRLAYARGDAAARDLADRLVALASSPGGEDADDASFADAASALLGGSAGPGWRTLPLVHDVLAGSARAAVEPAYVAVLPRRALDPCASRRALAGALPWLGERGALVPLVDTRPAVLVRADVAGVSVDFDGTLRLTRAGRRTDGGGRP